MTANEDSALAPRIHLYAEHLQNIRTLSIQASLATHSNTETTAVLAADGTSLSLTHEGETASIRLPISVPGDHNDATLHIPPAPSKELSFRLSLEEKPGSNLLGDRASSNSHVLPWTGADLTPETEICCAACESALVQRGSVKQWKDLPSENWAEMMDFWHCHKPDVPHEHDHDADGGADRGIGANSKLAIKPGVAMVGPLDLLFALENCQNVQVSSSSLTSAHENMLHCVTCKARLGNLDTNTDAYRLRKPRLAVSASPAVPAKSFGKEQWLACHLLTAAESQSVRKLQVYCHPVSDAESHRRTMQVWLFAIDLVASSSVTETLEPLHVVKIMHKEPCKPMEITPKLNAMTLSEGDLELPEEDFDVLFASLVESIKLLPPKAKKFQDWNVGLLRRFTDADFARQDG